MYPDINNQTFRLNKINELKDYFVAEIRERKLMSKGLSKYTALIRLKLFYLQQAVEFLFASFASVIGTPVGMASTSLSFAFSLTKEIVKKLLKQHEIRSKIIIKSLNSIESTISKALIDNEISCYNNN